VSLVRPKGFGRKVWEKWVADYSLIFMVDFNVGVYGFG